MSKSYQDIRGFGCEHGLSVHFGREGKAAHIMGLRQHVGGKEES